MLHISANTYERYDGINKKWTNKVDRNLSLKITEGILFVFHKYKVLETVCILQEQKNVRIASKDNYLAVAYIEKGHVSRFRVKLFNPNDATYKVLQKTNKIADVSTVVNVIKMYNMEVKLIDSTLANSEIHASRCEPNALLAPTTFLYRNVKQIKEIPVKELLKSVICINKYIPLSGCALDEELIRTLIFDSSFELQIEKEKEKVKSGLLWSLYTKHNTK